ncbi:2,3-dehydroadipyl-CoA hydratase [Aquisphaera giovannonii]|uniref:2,3-dehydroadipyl-CoA hydratase n=1 Tax=Aquisphaera giovannonii TaxID=406548 RepID=A0A5B9VXG1_9BACT|nr:enoyl-CoA hydratase-related protein [Aquisphaera giovannonii]QEH33066.1 2,3-dehydroadipyl-CoA hydratase [Aquisphaera giovannonii]
MPDPLVIRSDDSVVAVLTLNRPAKRNALSRALMHELEDHLDRAASESRVRAVVITGAGTAFCSGMDLGEAARGGTSAEAEGYAVATLQEYADLLQKVHTLPKLTIAAVNGDALAGGAGLMSACDLAIAATSARIGYPEVLRGLVPSTVMHDLTRLIGGRRARHLLLTGGLILADAAHEWGLVNLVTQPENCLKESIRTGKQMIESAPQAVAAIKRQLDEVEGRPRSLRGAAAVSAAIRVGEEAQEGVRAFLEKRPPRWAQSP